MKPSLALIVVLAFTASAPAWAELTEQPVRDKAPRYPAFEQIEALTRLVGPANASALIEPYVRTVFQMLYTQDFNGDGAISPFEPHEVHIARVEREQGPEAAERMRQSYRAPYERYLAEADLDRDGRVSDFEKFNHGIERMLDNMARLDDPAQIENYVRYYDQAMKPFDLDGDGKVHAAEYDRAIANRLDGQHSEWQERRDLALYDTDRDGKLSDAERRRMLDDLAAAYDAQQQQIARSLKTYDADGDGSLGAGDAAALRERTAKLIAELRAIEMIAIDGQSLPKKDADAILGSVRVLRYQPAVIAPKPPAQAPSDTDGTKPLTGE